MTALEQAPTLPMQELARAQQTVQACLALVLEEFRAAGEPLQLPAGVTLAAVSAQYASQILDSIDAAESPLAVTHRFTCRDAVAAFTAQEHSMRLRMSAAVAAACVAWGELPSKVSSLVQPLMAAIRYISEPALQRSVRLTLPCCLCLL